MYRTCISHSHVDGLKEYSHWICLPRRSPLRGAASRRWLPGRWNDPKIHEEFECFFFVSLSSWLVVIVKIVLKCAKNDYCYSINHDLLGAVRYSQQLSTCLVLVSASLCHLYYCEVAHADHAVCMNGFLMVHNKGASIDFTICHSGHTPYYVTLWCAKIVCPF